MTFGLPLEIYVDQAPIFTSYEAKNVTRIEQRLKFYDVSFVVANSPEAKGKIERIHQVWQDRLPPYFALNGITIDSKLEDVNDLLKKKPKAINVKLLKQYPEFLAFQQLKGTRAGDVVNDSKMASDVSTATPSEALEAAYQNLRNELFGGPSRCYAVCRRTSGSKSKQRNLYYYIQIHR